MTKEAEVYTDTEKTLTELLAYATNELEVAHHNLTEGDLDFGEGVSRVWYVIGRLRAATNGINAIMGERTPVEKADGQGE